MANNDNNSRRNRERPEDNPFIAFRRFADSQVSSLLNTVFTLPATIANYNNVHQAREACLFKKAGKAQCDKLQELEEEIASLRHEGKELYRVGDLQQVLRKSEELMQLDRHADELRKDIVAESGIKEEDSKELVQRVANKKGQEWGWDWSWGFPKPFDDDRDSSQPASADRHREQAMAFFKQIEREAKNMFGDEQWDDAIEGALGAMGSSPMLRALMGDKEWQEVKNFMNETRPYSPQALEADRRMQLAGVNWREAYEDLVRAQEQEDLARRQETRRDALGWRRNSKEGYPKRVPWTDEESDEPSYEYAHDHEDQHDDPPTPKAKQEGTFRDWCDPAENQKSSDKSDIMAYLREQQQSGRSLGMRQQTESESHDWCATAESQKSSDKDDIMAYLREQQQKGRDLSLREQAEDSGMCAPASSQSASDKRDIQAFLSSQSQQNDRHLSLREPEYQAGEWCDPASSQSASDKRDIRQFLSSEQQHGRQLGLRDSSATELDAYEHLLQKPENVANEAGPSILSTLTTTERSVAPDGSVTTRVVLKKRFADGREESTETVHTQRGQESDPRETARRGVAPKLEGGRDQDKKRSGWFWSS
jgi:hypothetical protein